MNKTIINDIDVSECEQIFAQKECALLDQVYCEDNPDCYFKQLKRLQEENEKLKEVINEAKIEYENLLINRNDFAERANKYKQALEEIRKEANRLLYEENPIYGYNNSNYFKLLAKYVLAKIKEVLND